MTPSDYVKSINSNVFILRAAGTDTPTVKVTDTWRGLNLTERWQHKRHKTWLYRDEDALLKALQIRLSLVEQSARELQAAS